MSKNSSKFPERDVKQHLTTGKVTNEVKENRFSRGKICPFCGHDGISKNGKFKCVSNFIKLSEASTVHSDTKIRDFKIRQPIYA